MKLFCNLSHQSIHMQSINDTTLSTDTRKPVVPKWHYNPRATPLGTGEYIMLATSHNNSKQHFCIPLPELLSI